MQAFLGDTHDAQEAFLAATFFEGTDNVLAITDNTKRAEMLLSMILLSETHVNKDTEDEPSF